MVWAFTAFLIAAAFAVVIILAKEVGKTQAILDEEKDDLQGVIDAQKQDAIVNRNPDVKRMRERLSTALRRKSDS